MLVGRVEYKVVRPMAFNEFLEAMGEKSALQQYDIVPIAEFTHEKMVQLFHTYTLIGGMPEVVKHYIDNRNLTALQPIYESLLVSYMNDVEKTEYVNCSMAAKDIYHDAVKQALIKDGWIVTDEPLTLSLGFRSLFVDLGAEKIVVATKNNQRIAVDMKSFVGKSTITELEKAIGQYMLYDEALRSIGNRIRSGVVSVVAPRCCRGTGGRQDFTHSYQMI